MTTIRELEYEIGANTDALNRAFPALQKLDQTIQRLEKTITKMAGNFESQIQRVTKASNSQSSAVGRMADKTKTAAEKNRMVLKDMADKVEKLNAKLKEADKPGLMGNNVNSLRAFERAIKDPTKSTDQLSLAKQRLQRTMRNTSEALSEHTRAQRANDAAARQQAGAMERQQVALTKAETEYNKLLRSLNSTKASQKRIDDLNASFGKLSNTLTSGPLTSTQAAQAQATFAKEIDQVRGSSNNAIPGIQALGERATDLAKSVQVALGPLSGIAARITAIASLANRTTIMIAGLIGAVIGLGTIMYKSIRTGSEFERQLYRIDSVLAVTGRTAQFTAEDIDNMARQLGRATLTTQGLARDAAATLLLNRKISREFFKGALLVSQGLSVIGEGTIASNIRRVSRLLEDPANNLRALSEMGVRFNAVERRKISLLQQSGNLYGAQAEVMRRLEAVQKAATGEARGLSGAWDSLLETMTDFSIGTTKTTGVLQGVAAVIFDLDRKIQSLSNDLQLAINIGYGFRFMVASIGGALRFLINNLDILIGIMLGFLAIGFVKWINSAVLALTKLDRTLGNVAKRFPALVAGLGKFLGFALTIGAITQLIDNFSRSIQTSTDYVSRFADSSGKGFEDIRAEIKETIDGANWLERKLGEISERIALPFMFTVREGRQRVLNIELQRAIDTINKQLAKADAGEVEIPLIPGLSIEESEEQFRKQVGQLQRSMKLIIDEFLSAMQEDRPADLSLSQLTEVADALQKDITRGLRTATIALSRYKRATDSANITVDSFDESLQDAAEALIQLREEYNSLAVEEEKLAANTKLLEDNFQDMMEVIKGLAGDQFPIYEAELHRIKLQQEAMGSATRSFITNLDNQNAALERDILISREVGSSRAALSREQAIWNARISSGLFLTNDYEKNIRALSPAQRAQLADLEKLTVAQWEYNRSLEASSKELQLANQYEEALAALELVNASERERNVQMAKLKAIQDLLQRGYEYDEEHWQRVTEQAAELVEMDFATQIQDSVRAQVEKIRLLNEEIRLGNATTMMRDEELAKLNDLIEMESKYGLEIDGVNTLLENRIKIREAERTAEHFKELRALRDQVKMQDEVVKSMFKSEVTKRQAVALAEKEVELLERYNSLTDERAKRELEVFSVFQQRERFMQTTLKTVHESMESLFKGLEDAIVSAFENGKLSMEDFARAVFRDVLRLQTQLFISQPLQDLAGGWLGRFAGGQMPSGAAAQQALTKAATMVVHATTVNLMGDLAGAPANVGSALSNVFTGGGGGAAGPGADYQTAIRETTKSTNELNEGFRLLKAGSEGHLIALEKSSTVIPQHSLDLAKSLDKVSSEAAPRIDQAFSHLADDSMTRAAQGATQAATQQTTLAQSATTTAAAIAALGQAATASASALGAGSAASSVGQALIKPEAGFFAGGFQHGGRIPRGMVGLVGEDGPEIYSGPATITPLDKLSGTSVVVNIRVVNEVPNTQVDQRVGEDGVTEILFRSVENMVAGSITSDGPVGQAVRNTFGLSRRVR